MEERESASASAVENAKRRCAADRLHRFPNSKLSRPLKTTLSRLIHSELNFLHRLSALSHPLSSNIGHLEAVVHVLHQPPVTGVDSERQNPIHNELFSLISGKRGIICESVRSEFQELISMCGGPNEKLRAAHFMKFLKVVPDCPSTRLVSLPTTRKLALKNKLVFGTGDYWCAPTVTANMAFVRAVSQTGISLSVIEHRPRALIGD